MVSPVGSRPVPLMQSAGDPPAAGGAPAPAGSGAPAGVTPGAPPAAPTPAGSPPPARVAPRVTTVAEALEFIEDLWAPKAKSAVEGRTTRRRDDRGTDERNDYWFYPRLGAALASEYDTRGSSSGFRKALKALRNAQNARQFADAIEALNKKTSAPVTGDDIKGFAIKNDSVFLKKSIANLLSDIHRGVNVKENTDQLYALLTSSKRGDAPLKVAIDAKIQALEAMNGGKSADAAAQAMVDAEIVGKDGKKSKPYAITVAVPADAAAVAARDASEEGGPKGYPLDAWRRAREIATLQLKDASKGDIDEEAEKILTKGKTLKPESYRGGFGAALYGRLDDLLADEKTKKERADIAELGKKKTNTFSNKLYVGAVDIGATSSPLVRNKMNLELQSGVFGLEAEIDINRGFRPGQGTDPTNLFGPGLKGTISNGVGLSSLTGTLGFFDKSFVVKAGFNEVWWEAAPLQGLFGKGILPAKINNQLGFLVLYDSSPRFNKNDDSFRFTAGMAGGFLADDINLVGGLGFVTGDDKKWAKQLDSSAAVQVGFKLPKTSKKSSVAIRGHVVATNKDDDTAADVMVNVASRIFWGSWQLGVDWRPLNSLSLAPGQTENTQWALATELGYSVAPFVFKLSANHYSGRNVRSVLAKSSGYPGKGLPEPSVTTTNLTDIGFGVEFDVNEHNKLALRGYRAWAPEGDGLAGTLMWGLSF